MENKSSTEPRRLGPHTYHIGGKNGAIVSFESLPDRATIDAGNITTVPMPKGNTTVKIMYWGKDNNLPYYREECITGNNIVPALIERKRNIIGGQGWYAYKEVFDADAESSRKVEVPMPEEAKAFFKTFNKTCRELLGELLKHGLAMPEFVRFARDGQKIASVKCLKTKHIRAGKKNAQGEIDTWYWGNCWLKSCKLAQEDRVIRDLPVYNGDKKQGRFVLPLMDDLFDDEYYPIPPYWGGRHWITLSNIIPLFHEANLKNGSAPRFHIIIPHDYFFDYEKYNQTTEGSEERTTLQTEYEGREKAFVDDFTAVLTNVSKAGRVITSKSELIEVMGKAQDKRIVIEELKYDMRDDALLELYKASNVANVSAQALHPTLASIETAGKGIGSGTEIRNAFLLYLIIAAPVYRDLLMEVVELVKNENGWPADINYAVWDAELTTLADNPAGIRPAETPIGE